MPGARFQPPAMARVRRDLVGRGVGAVFTNSRTEIFGSGVPVSLFGNPTQVIAPKHGYARKFVGGSSQYARITPLAGVIDLAGHFAVVVAFVLDNTATARIVHYSDTANNLNFQLVSLLGRLCVVVGAASSQFSDVSSAAVLTPGLPYVAVVGRGPTGFFMYLDGAAQPLGANGSGAIANNVVSTDVQIGRRGDGASYFSGQIALAAVIKGSVDAASLSLNPWQLFEEEDDDVFIAATVVPNSYVLAAAPGAFALSGSAAGVLASRKVNPEAGAFSLTGSAAAVRATRRMVVGATAFALNGASTGIRAVRKLSAGAGAFGIAGAAASLVAGRRLSAATGAFAVLGQTATLVHTAAPAPEGPTYVLTAAPGSFALATTAASLSVSRRVVAGAGVLDITASSARIAASRRLGAKPGQLELAGAAAVLQVARRMPAGAGAFMVAGTDVALKYSSQIEYARAPAGSGYAPRRIERQPRPVQVSSDRPSATEKAYR